MMYIREQIHHPDLGFQIPFCTGSYQSSLEK